MERGDATSPRVPPARRARRATPALRPEPRPHAGDGTRLPPLLRLRRRRLRRPAGCGPVDAVFGDARSVAVRDPGTALVRRALAAALPRVPARSAVRSRRTPAVHEP